VRKTQEGNMTALTEFTKGVLPIGEHLVTVVFDGHKPTASWGGAIPKPATAIIAIESRKQPRLTWLDTQTALGGQATITWMLKGDDISNPKANCRKADCEAFRERVKAMKHSGYKVKVWWGMR
jgi:hypothetical protein